MSLAFTQNGNKNLPPLVLIHAFPVNQTMWQNQVNGLADQFRITTIDLPGFGASPKSHGIPSLSNYVNEILETIGSLNIGPAVFGGCSMGGYIIFQLLKDHPHRIKGLILCDTKATADTEEARQNRYTMIQDVQTNGIRPLADTMIPKLVCAQTLDSNAKLLEELLNSILVNTPEGVCQALEAMAKREDFTPLLPAIKVPTLLIYGKDDTVTPPTIGQNLKSNIPGARLSVIQDAGHLSAYEQPEEVNQAIREFFIEHEKSIRS